VFVARALARLAGLDGSTEPSEELA
jgi:hypothetical protein